MIKSINFSINLGYVTFSEYEDLRGFGNVVFVVRSMSSPFRKIVEFEYFEQLSGNGGAGRRGRRHVWPTRHAEIRQNAVFDHFDASPSDFRFGKLGLDSTTTLTLGTIVKAPLFFFDNGGLSPTLFVLVYLSGTEVLFSKICANVVVVVIVVVVVVVRIETFRLGSFLIFVLAGKRMRFVFFVVRATLSFPVMTLMVTLLMTLLMMQFGFVKTVEGGVIDLGKFDGGVGYNAGNSARLRDAGR